MTQTGIFEERFNNGNISIDNIYGNISISIMAIYL